MHQRWDVEGSSRVAPSSDYVHRMSLHNLTRPPALSPGDTVGICTPSVPAHTRFRAKYLHGVEVLRKMGFSVVEGPLTARAVSRGHRAGTARERAAELNALFADPQVRAIICTIGGANSSSLVPYLDFEQIRAHPKVFCGYSDVTSLHLALMRHAGLSTFYGPAVMPSFGEWPDVLPETKASFLDAVTRTSPGPRALVPPTRWSNHFRDAAGDAWRTEPRQFQDNPGWRVVHPGEAEGPALVVNLNTLRSNAGTPEFPDMQGAVLFIEDMSTGPALAERGFRHLAAMGVFEQVAAVVWGKVEFRSDPDAPDTLEALLLEAIGRVPDIPVVTDFDCCHTVPMLTLAQGVPVRVHAPANGFADITVLEPMVSVPTR